MVPFYQSTLLLANVAAGSIYWDEVHFGTPLSAVMFWGGCAITICGQLLLLRSVHSPAVTEIDDADDSSPDGEEGGDITAAIGGSGSSDVAAVEGDEGATAQVHQDASTKRGDGPAAVEPEDSGADGDAVAVHMPATPRTPAPSLRPHGISASIADVDSRRGTSSSETSAVGTASKDSAGRRTRVGRPVEVSTHRGSQRDGAAISAGTVVREGAAMLVSAAAYVLSYFPRRQAESGGAVSAAIRGRVTRSPAISARARAGEYRAVGAYDAYRT